VNEVIESNGTVVVEEGMTEALIILKQVPIIEERLRSTSESIDKSVSEALSLVCNEETRQSVKDVRANLNKQFDELEEQRKAVKSSVLAPYEAFEKVYKECVTVKFATAKTELTSKIDEIENGIKEKLTAEAKAYFDEYATSKSIDFLPFENAGIKIALGATVVSLKKQGKAILDKVSDELALIDTQDNKAEILVEYKKCLNVAYAITTVSKRHADIEMERKRQEERKAAEEKEQPRIAEVESFSAPQVIAPVEEKKAPEQLISMEFRATGTMEQLKALKQYMNDNGIKAEKVGA